MAGLGASPSTDGLGMTARLLIEIVVVGMFVLPGLLALWVGIGDKEWFFSHPQARPWLSAFGRRGSRIVTIIVGLLLLACSLLFYIDPLHVMNE